MDIARRTFLDSLTSKWKCFMLTIKHSGSTKKLERFLGRMKPDHLFRSLDALGRVGVDALVSATPIDSGVTADSWGYEVKVDRGRATIIWTNTSQNQGLPIVILLQYGHGTGTGGYVQGNDFINPAIRPVFDKIADEVWKVVKNS